MFQVCVTGHTQIEVSDIHFLRSIYNHILHWKSIPNAIYLLHANPSSRQHLWEYIKLSFIARDVPARLPLKTSVIPIFASSLNAQLNHLEAGTALVKARRDNWRSEHLPKRPRKKIGTLYTRHRSPTQNGQIAPSLMTLSSLRSFLLFENLLSERHRTGLPNL